MSFDIERPCSTNSQNVVLYLSSLALWTTTTNQAGRMSFEGHVNLCCRAWFVLMETSSGRTPSMPWHLETPSSLWTLYSSWPKGWTTFAYPTQKSDFFALLSLLLQVIHCYNVWKLLKMSHLNFGILAFFANFWPIKTDLSGNTVWPQALGFQKLAKMDNFWHF